MIPKLTHDLLSVPFYRKEATPIPCSETTSPFNHILSYEMNKPESLDRLVLNFLIKTIESILSKPDQGDQGLPFSKLPLLQISPFQSSSFQNRPVPETGPEISETRPKGQEIDNIIQEAASQYGVDPSLIKAVISVESNGNPRAVSPAGAQGLMQLMPKTAAELGVTNPFDPAQNIKAGTLYLSRLLDRYQGNQKLALAAYNWGMGNLEKNPSGLPRETRNYVTRVEKQYQTQMNSSLKA